MFEPERKKVIVTGFLFLVFSHFLLAQVDPDGQQSTGTSFWKDLTSIFTVTVALIAAIISLIVAILTTNRIVKSEVEKQVKEKAKDYVDSFFAKELDVDPVTAKAFFRKLKADADRLKATQVWIVNDPKDLDRKSLFEVIKEAGFKIPKSITVDKVDSVLQPGDIMVFDATQHLTEPQIVDFGKPLEPQAYFFFYGGKRYKSDEALKMRSFANSPDTLVKRLKEVVLD